MRYFKVKNKYNEQQGVAAQLYVNGERGVNALVKAGYSPATARVPQKVYNSQGFKLALAREANNANRIVTAFLTQLDIDVSNGKIQDMSMQEKIKNLKIMADIGKMLSEQAGLVDKKPSTNELDGIIDINTFEAKDGNTQDTTENPTE